MNIINHGNELFKEYIFGLLYAMIDIKADNNYGEDNIHKAKTDDDWQAFLGNVDKAKIEKYKIKKSTHERYLSWISPLASFYLLDLLVCHNNDFIYLNILIYRNIIKAIDDIDERKLKKLNDFLKEKIIKLLTNSELYELKEKLKIRLKY